MYCANCKREISAETFQLHEAHCSRNITLCELCQEPVPLQQREEHYQTFHQPVTCPLCGASVRKDAMDQHKEQYCTEEVVQCQYCSVGIKRGVFYTHLESCGSRTDVCERCGRRVLLRNMLEHRREACPQTSESTEEHPGHLFSNCPWDKEDGSEKVNIDPAWVESVTAAMQGSGDGDTDAVLAQNLFLQELASDHSPDVMETDDTLNGGRDVGHGSVGEVWPTSSPTIQRDDQCRAEQLARDEALARQLQEDEDALYHATGDRPNGVSSETHWTAPPEGPKKATPSDRPTSVPQHGRGHQKRHRTLPTVTTPTGEFMDFRNHPFFRHSELPNWPFDGFHRSPFSFGGSFPPFSGCVASSFPRAPPTRRGSLQLHSSHGNRYYVEEPDD